MATLLSFWFCEGFQGIPLGVLWMWYHTHDACYELTGPSPPWSGSSLPALHRLLAGKPQPVAKRVVDVLAEGRQTVLPLDIFR